MRRSKASINSAKKVKQILLSLLGIGLFAILITGAISIRNKNSSVILIKIDKLGENKSMLVEKDIKNILERTYGFDLVGVPINDIDVLSVENLLKNVPHIKDANVFIDALKKVHVEVIPRKAILRIVDENGSNYFLDEDGIRLPISNNFTPRVLVAHGNIPQYHDRVFQEKEGVLYDMYQLGLTISKNPFLRAQLDQIYINKKQEAELIPKIGDHDIKFGELVDIDEKLEKLIAFYKDGISYKGWKTYSTIDLRFDRQVICGKIKS